MNYRELNAPDLVKQWRKIVNDNVNMGRDAKLLKDFLLVATPVQILYGMYQYQGRKSISILMFLNSPRVWLEEDEKWAEIELATYLTGKTPPEYYTYMDYCDELEPDSVTRADEARLKLTEWANEVLA